MQRPPETEAGFQAAVVELATLCGWLCYHDFDSRRNQAGFPDLVLVRNGHLIFAELKSEKGRTSPAQQVWLKELQTVTVAAEHHNRLPVRTCEWRPSDWDEIEAELR